MSEPPELLSPAEMGQADAAAPSLGVPGWVLMQNAGRAVARAIRRHFRPMRTLVLAGPGNNGGDGYVAARLLQQEGWPVSVAALAPPRAGSDAALAAADWHGPCTAFTPAEAARADLVVDAVFGAGLARDVSGVVAETLAAARRIVAVDVPSGLDGANGMVRGAARAAEVTVTFFRLKPGHVLLPGRALCGTVILADIGMPPGVLGPIAPRTFVNGSALWRVPRPGVDAHKYARGHVTVLGGDTMTGAARLTAEAARRVGAGLVTIAPVGSAAGYGSVAPGTLVTDQPLADLLADKRREVWICGPGLGVDAARAALPVLQRAERKIVGDADVFSAFRGDPDALRGCTVLTPHMGEFTRVFGAIESDRLQAARDAAHRTGAVVLLKGADTVIAAPDGRVAINTSAPPWLATAGAGDVLAGLIVGLLAQGMPAWEAASAAAWLHGRAAATVGEGLIVEELVPAVRTVLCSLPAQT